MDKVAVNVDKCSLCGLCIRLCPVDILVEGPNAVQTVESDRCYFCGHCKAVCPENALTFPALDELSFAPVLTDSELRRPDQLLLRFRSRRTTRQFQSKPVAKELVEKILQAGRYAPSGNNRQGIQYLIIHSEAALAAFKKQAFEALEHIVARLDTGDLSPADSRTMLENKKTQTRYARMFTKKWSAWQKGEDRLFYQAPALIFCHADPERVIWPTWDAALGAMQMVLMTEALGLGSCFNGALLRAIGFSDTLRAALPIPAAHEIPVCFMIGYPAVRFVRTVYRDPVRASWI